MKSTELTPHEKDVLYWMAEGLGSRQIGMVLGMNEHIITGCQQQMIQKAEVSSVAQLLNYAVKKGIISL